VREAPPAYVAEDRPVPPPLGNTGFQMAFRTGATFPAGRLRGDTELADVFGWQIPLMVELGGKPNKHLFVGGYVGFGLGGSSSGPGGCGVGATECVSFSARVGFEIQYHIAPDDRLNPWLGYGIGYQSISLSRTNNGRETTDRASGWEYGRFMAGLDVRVSKSFGVGPFAELSVGEYLSESSTQNGFGSSNDIIQSRPHFWVTIGPRFVMNP
jgi:hypothetical protein